MHRFTIALSALVIFAAACGGSDSDSNENDSESTRTYEDLSFLEKSFVDGVTEGGGTEAAGICMLDAFEDAGIDASELADPANEEPSPDVLAAIFSCSAELFEGDLFGGDGVFSDADTYGDDPDLDALWDDCDAGDDVACDDLYLRSPIGSDYESFGSTCGERESIDQFGNCSLDDGLFGDDDGLFGDADTYGDDPDLDAHWDGCADGDYAACDTLWIESPFGSDYESFAETCGAISEESLFGSCELEFG
ncbi:MAG: hypothetical protein L7U66_00220 [Acidimicrobiales bacterium]|nr:hypothetical protein [Acidimicrobiales bacterium]